MKKIIFVSIILVISTCFATVIYAQKRKITTHSSNSTEYETALGIKFGWFAGGAISAKHFINNNDAIEGLLSFWNRGFRLTGLYEFYWALPNTDGLRIYAGPGAHLGVYNSKYYGGHAYLGIDGVLGLDYKIRNAPINLSLDFQPSFELGYDDSFYGWGGLGIRYTF